MPLLGSCSGDGGAGSCSGELLPRNADEIVLCNVLGDPLLARFALPDAATASAERVPAVVVLHGSAGLVRKEKGECTEEPIGRFSEWEQLLTDRGYAVIMPESYYSRGSCDRPPSGYDDHEMLVERAYDVAAAANYLCRHP